MESLIDPFNGVAAALFWQGRSGSALSESQQRRRDDSQCGVWGLAALLLRVRRMETKAVFCRAAQKDAAVSSQGESQAESADGPPHAPSAGNQ